MPLTTDERQSFLAEARVAALSVDAGPGRGPLSVPVWYSYEPGGDVLVITGSTSRKMRLIKAAGRFTLLVERTEPTVRYVSVEGPVMSEDPATEEEKRAMARRFLPPASAEIYLRQAGESSIEEVAVRMRPEHWLSADMGAV